MRHPDRSVFRVSFEELLPGESETSIELSDPLSFFFPPLCTAFFSCEGLAISRSKRTRCVFPAVHSAFLPAVLKLAGCCCTRLKASGKNISLSQTDISFMILLCGA